MTGKRTLRVVFAPLAAQDIEAIGDYIARDSPKRALRFITELRAVCTTIASEIPDAVADLGDVDLIRNAFIGFQKHLYASDRGRVI